MSQEFSVTGQAEALIVAVDNGGTNTRVEARLGALSLGIQEYPTPQDYEVAIAEIGNVVRALAPMRSVQAIGFAVAGRVLFGRIVSAGQLQEYGWTDRPFSEDVAQELGMEKEGVVLMNDCVAAAKSQQVHNRYIGSDIDGYVMTISTGVGGAGFMGRQLIADEPGHEFLRSGAVCGCGGDGCVEAHISGSGIFRKWAIKAEELPGDFWEVVVQDAVSAHVDLLNRLERNYFNPNTLYYFGSLALRSAQLLPGISRGLLARRDELPKLPNVAFATHGENSGLAGAAAAAKELLLR